MPTDLHNLQNLPNVHNLDAEIVARRRETEVRARGGARGAPRRAPGRGRGVRSQCRAVDSRRPATRAWASRIDRATLAAYSSSASGGEEYAASVARSIRDAQALV